MKRIWVIFALLLADCGLPTEAHPPADTPTPASPSDTPSATSPTNTPTIALSNTPSGPPGLSTLLFDPQQVWREAHIDSAGLPPSDLVPELVEAGDCQIDCAGLFYPTESNAFGMNITLISFADGSGASGRVRELAQDSLAAGAREVILSETAVGVDFLPDGYRVFYLDQSWSVYASYGYIFVAVILEWTVEIDFSLPEDDVISFSHVTAQVASAQVEKLIEAGF